VDFLTSVEIVDLICIWIAYYPLMQGKSLHFMYHVIKVKEFVLLSLIPSVFLTGDYYRVLYSYMCSLLLRFGLIDLLFHLTQVINRNNTKSHRAIRKPIVSEH